ncbi:MAG: Hsp70 family protein [Deltaproteobacteria bacterium]|nr:Hsp70 family protein [Deltaproteobacteria bacterium]
MTDILKPTIVGIDLGTTNSLVSVPVRDDRPIIVANERGERVTPSVVTIQQNEILVGELAKSQAVLNHENTISLVKRVMGGDQIWNCQGRELTPESVSSEILKYLKGVAESYLGYEVTGAVITVPAYFNDLQREATMRAGELAGLKVYKLFNEPTAAALAYGLQRNNDDHLLVFDFGGGTLDITFLEVKDGAFLVQGVGGDTRLGGVDFDRLIVENARDYFKKIHGPDLFADPLAYQQLLSHAEKAKVDLSAVKETRIMIPYVTVTKKGPLHLNMPLSRETLESLAAPILDNIHRILQESLESANLDPNWVGSVVLVGGSSRIPCVRRLLAETFPIGVTFRYDLNPEEIVAIGAGVLAGVMAGIYHEIDFRDVVSHDLGIEDDSGEFVKLINRGASYPLENDRLFTTTRDNQTEVTVHVLQRAELEDELISLGHFTVGGLPPAKAGEPDIKVTFSIDQHGLLQVRAEEVNSGVNQEIQLTIHPTKAGNTWHPDDSKPVSKDLEMD